MRAEIAAGVDARFGQQLHAGSDLDEWRDGAILEKSTPQHRVAADVPQRAMLGRLVMAFPIRDVDGEPRVEVVAREPFALAARRPHGFGAVEKDNAARAVIGRYHDG